MKISARIPLLYDHHSHPSLYAALADCPDLSVVTDKSRALKLISGSFSGNDITVVTGWNDGYFAFDEREIDAFPPLVIFNLSLHGLLMNDGARRLIAGRFPELVENHRDPEWLERNTSLLLNFLVAMKGGDAGQLRSYFSQLAEQGVWRVEEMSLRDEAGLEVFSKASLLERTVFWTDAEGLRSMSTEARGLIRGVKLFADGALGVKSARLGRPYLSGTEGVLVYGDEELYRAVCGVYDRGKAVAVHAIGDAAIDQVVRVLERIAEQRCGLPETRIEHCQFISRRAAVRAKAMGVILSMQPNFSLDSVCYRDRLPEEYRMGNNPFRMLLDEVGYVSGRDLLLGSDGMPHGIRCALESALFPPCPGQKLTLAEFTAGYCMPDFNNGHINVSIDYEAGKVDAEVALK